MALSRALAIKHLTVSIDQRIVINDLTLDLKSGQTHFLMGPNGSGKSSLSLALMGHPHYLVTGGKLTLDGENLLGKSPDERAHLGLFLAFQNPLGISGISVQNALKTAYEAIHCSGCDIHPHCPKLSVTQFRQELIKTAQSLNLNPDLLNRSLNDGFSGGERKRVEMLTLLTLKPQYAILDEIDSGLDIDSLRLVAAAINQAVTQLKLGVLLITHYRRILDYVQPNQVSILIKGKLVQTGGPALIDHIEKNGYKSFI